MSPPLLIVGASVRAAAQSACRAGYDVFACDLFTDADLAAIATERMQVSSLGDIPRACRHLPPMPWMYVGGMENHPSIIAEMAAERPLLGNSAAVLRRIRDPQPLDAVCRKIGLSLPPMKSQLEASDDPAAWLFKGTRSSAGLQVYPASERPTKLPGYFQQRIAGFSWSAAFVASAGRAHLLGIFEQLIGSDWYAPRPFQYAGNIGPLPFAQRDQVAKLGNELAAAFSLQGLFGLDFLLDGAERIWPLEVNPRYTASMELAERAHGGLSLAAAHVAACASREITWPANQEDRRACHGKGIVYAPADCAIPAALCQQLQEANANQPWPLWGDIPTAQSSVPAGAPVATALASAAAADAVRAELLERRSWLLRQITTSDE